jgi:hypothetical protein
MSGTANRRCAGMPAGIEAAETGAAPDARSRACIACSSSSAIIMILTLARHPNGGGQMLFTPT